MKKPNPAQQDKARAERGALMAASQDAKATRELMIATADTEEKMLLAASLSINDVLLLTYKQQSGCQSFKTFHDWKTEGYTVKKGEKAFRIWGRPIKAKNGNNDTDNTKADDEEQGYKLFPMCCLFNERQVEKMNSVPDADPVDLSPTVSAPVTDAAAVTLEPVAVSSSPFVMVDIEERQDAKRQRLEDRAAKKRSESDQQHKRSRALVEHIPFGQPILVGHHSERAHRNTLDKSWAAMGKSVALSEYADHLESRAASVGSAGIASSDPEALAKLAEKLESLQRNQEAMKAANKAIRAGNDQALVELGFNERQIVELKKAGLYEPRRLCKLQLTKQQCRNKPHQKTYRNIEKAAQQHAAGLQQRAVFAVCKQWSGVDFFCGR